MSTEEIIEGNKLIDEFAPEITKLCRQEYLATIRDTIELKYHTSWDWLMPVVEKIENLWNPFSDNCIYNQHEGSEFNINSGYVDLDTAGYKNENRLEFRYTEYWDLKDKSEEVKRYHVWESCVQFIQWYNQTKIKTNEQ